MAGTGRSGASVGPAPTTTAQIQRFPTRAAASAAAAQQIAQALRTELAQADQTTLVVSGGSTPAACYAQLAQEDLPWARVHILLSDERCVPAQHPDRNARMLRETLLTGPAKAATLLPLEVGAVARAPQPWVLALLGMGTDGHFASLFPDADNLAQGLAAEGDALVLPVRTAASPHPRVSLSWRALRQCRSRLLLAFGADKAEVLAAPAGKPVATLLSDPELTVLWAP